MSGTPARQQLAANEAGNLLAQFVPPPGAVRLAKKPTLPSGGGASLVYTTTVHAVRYWRVHGNPTTLLAWEKAHMPRAFSQEDVIIGPPSWNTFYTLPAVPHRFAAREINAQFYDVGGGETVIMADAMVAWLPPRPATEVIPASVTVVTIADSPLAGADQATITAVPVIRQLAALVNGLSPSVIGPALCPMGAGLTMTFRAAPGGPPAAVAQGPGGCGSVGLQLNGKNQPDLMVTDKAAYEGTVLKIAGLHWKLIP
ncbi:MAG TPA: hypothetical protein VN714_04195 [Trebonia sp.]|nr:hypothetical protein [Trebonia sp.]